MEQILFSELSEDELSQIIQRAQNILREKKRYKEITKEEIYQLLKSKKLECVELSDDTIINDTVYTLSLIHI